MSQLQIRRLSYALGAEVRGIDLTQPLSTATVSAIRQAWLDNLVLCFPGQRLTPDSLTAFTEYFGEIDDNRKTPYNRHPDYEKVLLITNRPEGKTWNGYRNGQNWHTDLSYTDHPATGTFLYCEQCPDVGGDTMFANMYMAYESLSPTMQRMLDPLGAIHDQELAKGAEKKDPEARAAGRLLNPPIVHPVVRVHPETGRKALYVNERVRRIVGLSEAESAPLLAFLNEHSVQPEHVYRHRWSVGDLILWDNRCLMHIALGDFDQWGQPRRMIRTSLLGPQSGRVYSEDMDRELEAVPA